MAWPCITRACCINRFWSELDKGDIAVPLVFTKYSDATDEQRFHPLHQPKRPQPQARVAIETQPTVSNQVGAARAPPAASATAAAEGLSSSVMRQDFKAWKVRPERSCKPKNEYHPSETPFNNETQYQKDFKPWPIPKKRDHPWIPKPTTISPVPLERPQRSWHITIPASAEDDGGVEKSEIADKVQEKQIREKKKKQSKKEKAGEKISVKTDAVPLVSATTESKGRAAADALNRQIKEEVTTGSSYRNEFKAYADVKPVRPIRARSQYTPPVEDKSSLETSYSSSFRGEQVQRQPGDNRMQERRRIRSLYSEPSKDPVKVERPSTPRSKTKKTTAASHSKPAKKAKDKESSLVRSTKKQGTDAEIDPPPAEGDKKKRKELNNKLAEAKE